MRPPASPHERDDPRRAFAPALLIGVGLGGFVDGIVLHQILQWHHMLTNTPDDRLGLDAYPAGTVDGLEANTLADGLFHAATWVAVTVGVLLLWRVVVARPRPFTWSPLVGGALAGWGLFNLVEGVVNHHLLGLHHVRMASDVDHVWVWDVGFLALGALLLAGGLAIARRGARDGRAPG